MLNLISPLKRYLYKTFTGFYKSILFWERTNFYSLNTLCTDRLTVPNQIKTSLFLSFVGYLCLEWYIWVASPWKIVSNDQNQACALRGNGLSSRTENNILTTEQLFPIWGQLVRIEGQTGLFDLTTNITISFPDFSYLRGGDLSSLPTTLKTTYMMYVSCMRFLYWFNITDHVYHIYYTQTTWYTSTPLVCSGWVTAFLHTHLTPSTTHTCFLLVTLKCLCFLSSLDLLLKVLKEFVVRHGGLWPVLNKILQEECALSTVLPVK